MSGEGRDNAEKAVESVNSSESARNRFSEEFSNTAIAYNDNIRGNSGEDELPDLRLCGNEEVAEPSHEIANHKEIEKESSNIAELLSGNKGFGTESERDQISDAIKNAMDKGISKDLIERINEKLKESGSGLSLDCKYLYSYKNMPPTIAYGLSLTDGAQLVDSMKFFYQSKGFPRPH